MVKRYEILDGNPGHGYTLVERDTGSWVSADNYDADRATLEAENAKLRKVRDHLAIDIHQSIYDGDLREDEPGSWLASYGLRADGEEGHERIVEIEPSGNPGELGES